MIAGKRLAAFPIYNSLSGLVFIWFGIYLVWYLSGLVLVAGFRCIYSEAWCWLIIMAWLLNWVGRISAFALI
ncbi:MAG: hypothetical protein CMI12_13040 [Oceanospirillum sp.]|nr:hypothetical protein [Oceanospirillum sp.]